MSVIIGLVGAKGAGKTTAFKFIQAADDDAVEITLAAKLKDVCAQVFDIPRFHFDSHDFKEVELSNPAYMQADMVKSIFQKYDSLEGNEDKVRKHVGKILFTPRQIAQYVGTEVLRDLHPDIHCQAALKAADLTTTSLGIVTDLRFPNEFEFFNKTAELFVPIYIKNTKAESYAAGDTHASEAYLFDLAKKSTKVDNESTIEDFQANLYKTLYALGVI